MDNKKQIFTHLVIENNTKEAMESVILINELKKSLTDVVNANDDRTAAAHDLEMQLLVRLVEEYDDLIEWYDNQLRKADSIASKVSEAINAAQRYDGKMYDNKPSMSMPSSMPTSPYNCIQLLQQNNAPIQQNNEMFGNNSNMTASMYDDRLMLPAADSKTRSIRKLILKADEFITDKRRKRAINE